METTTANVSKERDKLIISITTEDTTSATLTIKPHGEGLEEDPHFSARLVISNRSAVIGRRNEQIVNFSTFNIEDLLDCVNHQLTATACCSINASETDNICAEIYKAVRSEMETLADALNGVPMVSSEEASTERLLEL